MTDHWCSEHKTVWFKKGKMRGFAHPLVDENAQTVGWCNEPEETEEEAQSAAIQQAADATKTEPAPSAPVVDKKPPEIPKQGYKADPAKTDSIERQVAVKLACEISSDTDTMEQIFTKADKIIAWIKGI